MMIPAAPARAPENANAAILAPNTEMPRESAPRSLPRTLTRRRPERLRRRLSTARHATVKITRDVTAYRDASVVVLMSNPNSSGDGSRTP